MVIGVSPRSSFFARSVRLTTSPPQLPPVMNYASAALKKEIIPEVLAGRKYISLAISEAFAGSDVAGLRCTATKTADGKHYIVNGTKKWITNGTFSDYFSTGVNTGNGLSMLLVRPPSFSPAVTLLTQSFADPPWRGCRDQAHQGEFRSSRSLISLY